MQLIRSQGQDAFSIPLRGIASLFALFAELFELMVQVTHVFLFPVSVSEHPSTGMLRFRYREQGSWDTTPIMT